jgi:hypothetical protein
MGMRRDAVMKVSDVAVEVSKIEGKKKQLNIAQIKEILKVVNKLTHGELYKIVRFMDEP